MKKFLLFAAGIMLATTASAQWAVVGSYTTPSWNFAASTTFEGVGDDLSCTIDYLTNDFKIVDITNNNWDVQYGTSTPLEVNTPIVLTGKVNGNDPSNMTFSGLIQAVKNATVKWNPSTATMEIVAETSDLVIAYPTLYVTGSFCGWTGPGEGETVLMEQNNGIYTATVNLGSESKTEFKVAGTNWSNEIAGGVEVNDQEAVAVTKGGGNLFTTLTGEQTLTFNYNTMMMTFGDPSLVEETPVTPAKTWALVGAYCGWSFESAAVFEGEGDNLSCEIENLTNDFKVVDITNNNWDVQYGTATPLEINTQYVLDAKNGGADPANMKFAGLIQEVNNATVKWNPSEATFEIVAEESDLVIAYPTLYVTGSFCEWAEPGKGETVLMTENNGVYTATVDLGETDGETEFKLAGPGWSNEIAGGVEIGFTAVEVTFGGDNLFTTLTGEQTIVFNYDEMTLYFDKDSGVESIESSDNAPAVYFNLQGVKVSNPENGIFIMKKGDKTSKVVIR